MSEVRCRCKCLIEHRIGNPRKKYGSLQYLAEFFRIRINDATFGSWRSLKHGFELFVGQHMIFDLKHDMYRDTGSRYIWTCTSPGVLETSTPSKPHSQYAWTHGPCCTCR